jgi:glucokinase
MPRSVRRRRTKSRCSRGFAMSAVRSVPRRCCPAPAWCGSRALDPRAACHEAETIAASALAREPSAQAAARLFVRLLGRFAGGLALTFKALGGVHIAGGVASGLGPLLDEPQFRAAFEAHPPYQRLLEAIPTLLITCEEPGLIGCAAVASEHAVTA